jgi:hypothetical protein
MEVALGLLAAWPGDQPPPFDVGKEIERTSSADADFTQENGKFIEAARRSFKPTPRERLQRVSS